MSGLEFNGDVRFNRADLNGGLKKGIKSDNSTNIDIGKLLGSSNKKEIGLDDLMSCRVKLEQLTTEAKEAKAELDKKVSSSGMSYADAEKKVNEIREKYNGDEYYNITEIDPFAGGTPDLLPDKISEEDMFKRGTPDKLPFIVPDGEFFNNKGGTPDLLPNRIETQRKEFDWTKLPEPARTEYKEAMEAKKEIENQNADLVKKAGITPQNDDVKIPEINDEIVKGLKKALGREENDK